MNAIARRVFLRRFASIFVIGPVGAASLTTSSLASAQVAKPRTMPEVKALIFDVFGTMVDWRTGVAREAKAILGSRGRFEGGGGDRPSHRACRPPQ